MIKTALKNTKKHQKHTFLIVPIFRSSDKSSIKCGSARLDVVGGSVGSMEAWKRSEAVGSCSSLLLALRV